ncbi:MAG: hypothetical protein DRJ49_07060 [Thermoprotei archaeon]|nr:MAG: hypothetical protein DRJ49_07060 [Thermoprotei archaeon]
MFINPQYFHAQKRERGRSSAGRVYVRVRIYNTVDLTHGKEVELLVDSGSIHTVIPSEVLEELKIKPIEEMDVEVFRGVIVRRKYGIAVVEYENKFRGITVVFGEDKDTPVMGVALLEQLGYVVDPISRKLVP